jgi:ABC-2 type transport system ATP-binding protein
MDAIVAEGLRKRYDEVQALDGVSVAVREGEVFGLLGPNGAGKSTTVRVLVTLTHADQGRAAVAGHDVVSEANAVRARSAARGRGRADRVRGSPTRSTSPAASRS